MIISIGCSGRFLSPSNKEVGTQIDISSSKMHSRLVVIRPSLFDPVMNNRPSLVSNKKCQRIGVDDLAGMIFAKSCNLDSSAVLEIEIVIVPVFLKAPGKSLFYGSLQKEETKHT